MKKWCLSLVVIRLKPLASSYGVALLALNASVLLLSTAAFGQVFPGNIQRSNLEQQLDIPLNNGIQGEDRDQADFLLRLGGQALGHGNYEKAIANWWQALDLYQRVGDLQGT
jgi:hypothetical protein